MQPNAPSQLPTPQPPSAAPQQVGSSLDYLNQISAPAQQKTVNPLVLWLGIGGFLLLLVGVVCFALNSGGPNYKQRLTSFAQRVDALKTLVDESQATIQSTELRRENSALSLALTNTSRDAAEPLKKVGVKKLGKPAKTSTLTKEFTALSERLEDARLNTVFDRVYSREIAYELSTLRSETKSLRKASNSKSLGVFLDAAESNLGPLNEQFAAFNNTQG